MRRSQTTLAPIVTLVLVALSSALLFPGDALAEDADAQAKDLIRKYRGYAKASRDISNDPGWIAFKQRLTSIRTLGPLDCDRSRKGLLRIVTTTKRLDDRFLAAQGLARSADVATVRALLAALAKKAHPVLTQGAGEALGGTKHAGVKTWLAAAPSAAKNDTELAIILRAGRTVPLEPSQVIAAYDAHASGNVDLAFDAIHALSSASTPEADDRILKAAGHGDERLRIAAADVLPARKRSATLDAATRKLLTDDIALVRYAMLKSLGKAKALHFLPEMSERLIDEDRRTRKTALTVLKAMTGQDFGFDMGAWRRWHEKKGAKGKPGTNTVPSYHGLPIWSDRLAFILDKSGSMRWPSDPAVTTRMAVAQGELTRVLGLLPKGTLFNVLAFDGKSNSWKKSEAVAGDATIAKARRFVAKQSSERGADTNTYDVLQRTLLQNPKIDTIYLLSDGIPESGKVISQEGLLAAVRNWNRYRRVSINTFAITHMGLKPGLYARTRSMNRAQSFMQLLAYAGGGQYRLVRIPK